MPDVRYARRTEVLWRLAPGKVLVVRPAIDPSDTEGDAASDLLGVAASVWVALDEPGSADQIIWRLTEAGADEAALAPGAIGAALDELVTTGWVIATAP